jgi:hypothetical protein
VQKNEVGRREVANANEKARRGKEEEKQTEDEEEKRKD